MKLSSIFLVLSLAFTLSAQEPMMWQQRTDVGSPGLYEAATMAFDAQQGVMLHFGGVKYVSGSPLGFASNDLWQYNGAAWQQVTVTGTLPVARSGHAMVYDPVDGRVLMFGGDGGGAMLGDLWAFEFSGPAAGSWVQLASLPSAGRSIMAMGYDAARDEFIVTGGIKEGTAEVEPPNGPTYGTVKPATRETWLWNRTVWAAGPQAPEYINGPTQNDVNYFIKAGPAGGVVAHHAESGKTMLLSERIFAQLGLPFANYFYGAGDWPLYDGVQWEANHGGIVSVLGGSFPRSFYTSSPTRVVATYDPARRRVVAFGAGKTTSEEFTGT
ncbi:MAG: kelch repeat-containing protein, partial [Prosthecobacter sp.]